MNRSLLLRRASLVLVVGAAFLTGAISARSERQPRMKDALHSLQEARSALRDADNDKGGHRKNALKYVDRAIDEVNRGISFDDRHH